MKNEGLKRLITLVEELKNADDGFDVVLCVDELELEYKKQIDEAYQRGYKDGIGCVMKNIHVVEKNKYVCYIQPPNSLI